MYWLVFIVILAFACLEVINKKINVKSFYFVYIVLTVMTIIRKGQGSDYYNYWEIYREISVLSQNSILPLLIMKDPGFSLLNYVAIQLGISYEYFSAICSFLIMAILYRFFSRTCKKSMIPLFFYYATFYLIYSYSALRQGLTLAILLGFVYPLLRERKVFKCVGIIFLASLFHQSFLVCLLFLLVYRIQMDKKALFILLMPFILNLLFSINIMGFIPIPGLLDRMDNYVEEGNSSSIMAILVRLIVLIPLFLVPNRVYEQDENIRGVRNILACGFLVYSLFSFNDLISSRLAVYFRVFEGLFLYMLLYRANLKKVPKQLFTYFTCISMILFVKDINSFIEQGEYENCNVVTYPFLTLFDDDNTIMYYRKNLGMADR